MAKNNSNGSTVPAALAERSASVNGDGIDRERIAEPRADWTAAEAEAWVKSGTVSGTAKTKVALFIPGLGHASASVDGLLLGNGFATANALSALPSVKVSLPKRGDNYTDEKGNSKPTNTPTAMMHGQRVAAVVASKTAPAM